MARRIVGSVIAAGVLGVGMVSVVGTSTTAMAAEEGPAISLAKEAGEITEARLPDGASAGDTITYTFTVTNTGDEPLTDVAVTDPAVGEVDCPAGELAPGDPLTCTAEPYELTQEDVDAGVVENTATATATAPEGTDPPTPAETTVSTSVPSLPAIGMVKVHAPIVDNEPEGLSAGDTVPYSFTVTNTGNRSLVEIEVTDNKLTEPVVCEETELAPAERTICTGDYTLTEDDMAAGEVVNNASVTAAAAPNANVDARTEVTADGEDRIELPGGPSLSLDKEAARGTDVDGDGRLEKGDEIEYGFTVTNNGNREVTNVQIQDELVTNLVCRPATLVAGDSTTCTADPYVVTAADVRKGSVRNVATATAVTVGEETITSQPDSTSTSVVETDEPQVQPTASASGGSGGNTDEGAGGGAEADAENTADPENEQTAGELPDTGGFSLGYLLGGLALAVLGGALMLRGRGKRNVA